MKTSITSNGEEVTIEFFSENKIETAIIDNINCFDIKVKATKHTLPKQDISVNDPMKLVLTLTNKTGK